MKRRHAPPRLLLACSLVLAALPAQDWPQQLGPARDGVVAASGTALAWPEGRPPVAWQATVGFGAAPVVVAQGRVYAFGLFKAGTDPGRLADAGSMPRLEEVAKGGYPLGRLPGLPPETSPGAYPSAYRGDLYARCLDAATGRQLWATRLTEDGIAFKTTRHSSTAWELASPLIAGGRLFLHTHTGRLYALDAALGALLWQRDLGERGVSTWYGGQQGDSCAPLLIGDHLMVGSEGSQDGRAGLVVMAFAPATGAELWTARLPFPGLNARTARLGAATIAGVATVLCSCGGGTAGLDPADGRLLWGFDLVAANPGTMQQVPAAFAAEEKTRKDYRIDAMRPPFPGYCPLAEGELVIDAACVGHNAATSALWCLRIAQGTATRVWQSSDFVPLSASLKSHLVVRAGRIYGFDSYFPGFAREYGVSRPYRGAETGEFQCRELSSGRLLWSSDAFNPQPPGPQRADSTGCRFIFVGDQLVVAGDNGVWLAVLHGDGLQVLAHVPQVPRQVRMLSEPVVADGRLYLRQVDAEGSAGLAPVLGAGGNLTCLDLGAR